MDDTDTDHAVYFRRAVDPGAEFRHRSFHLLVFLKGQRNGPDGLILQIERVSSTAATLVSRLGPSINLW